MALRRADTLWGYKKNVNNTANITKLLCTLIVWPFEEVMFFSVDSVSEKVWRK